MEFTTIAIKRVYKPVQRMGYRVQGSNPSTGITRLTTSTVVFLALPRPFEFLPTSPRLDDYQSYLLSKEWREWAVQAGGATTEILAEL